MNAADLYQITERDVRNGRVDYNRSIRAHFVLGKAHFCEYGSQ